MKILLLAIVAAGVAMGLLCLPRLLGKKDSFSSAHSCHGSHRQSKH